MSIKRLPNWPDRLQAAEDYLSSRPFAWGVHDCAQAAVYVLSAITGQDVTIPAYGSRQRGRKLVRDTGYPDLQAMAADVATKIGLVSVRPALARRGDLLAVRNGRSLALGFIGTNGRPHVATSPVGLASPPLDQVVAAWRVG